MLVRFLEAGFCGVMLGLLSLGCLIFKFYVWLYIIVYRFGMVPNAYQTKKPIFLQNIWEMSF